VVGLALVLDGLLFGLAHAELEQLAGLAVFGCILAFVAFKTQRLGMNMVSHATFNLVAVLAIVHDRAGFIH
jgi:membrane protease YdiL (CAAX protease family)